LTGNKPNTHLGVSADFLTKKLKGKFSVANSTKTNFADWSWPTLNDLKYSHIDLKRTFYIYQINYKNNYAVTLNNFVRKPPPMSLLTFQGNV